LVRVGKVALPRVVHVPDQLSPSANNMKHIKTEGSKLFAPAMREVMHLLEPQFQDFSRTSGIPVMQLKAEAGYLIV